MGQRKGQTGNPDGRPKGARNKITTEVKQKIDQIINNNIEKFESDLEDLEPKDRLMIMTRLLEYVLPKNRNIEIDLQEMPVIVFENVSKEFGAEL